MEHCPGLSSAEIVSSALAVPLEAATALRLLLRLREPAKAQVVPTLEHATAAASHIVGRLLLLLLTATAKHAVVVASTEDVSAAR